MAPRLALAGILVSILFAGCGKRPGIWDDAPAGQKRVLAVTPPLYCFAKRIGGDKVAVRCLLTTVGPHDYEPTADDALLARGADLFLANGLSLDDGSVAKVATSSGNKKLQIFKVGSVFEEKAEDDPKLHEMLVHNDEHEHGDEGHKHKHAGEHDPHIWLSPPLVKHLSALIADKLIEMDPANKAAFQANLAAFNADLDGLIRDGEAAFAKKKKSHFLTTHDSMRYFAHAFGLEEPKAIQLKPGHEVEARRLKELVDWCKAKNVRVICVEPQYSKGAAETLQTSLKKDGIDLKLVEFDPMETFPPGKAPDAAHYIERMRKNIQDLAKDLP
ncbi:MAG: metal ABC transporter substrate-binding protein [Gemmataceae bacterium]